MNVVEREPGDYLGASGVNAGRLRRFYRRDRAQVACNGLNARAPAA